MKRSGVVTLLAFLATGAPATSQTTVIIDSGGSAMVCTAWSPAAGPSAATLLLVPGWGGGPEDVLGIARSLSGAGVGVLVVVPRGWHSSGGDYSFAGALDDIAAALAWIRDPNTSSGFGLDRNNIVLGGHSWGGGMSLAHAARDSSVSRVISVAGTDHGQFIRQYESDPDFAAMVDRLLSSSAAPEGPIRFNVAEGMRELASGQEVFGLMENVGPLTNRSVLLIGGWEDVNVTIDDTLLPLFRALRSAGNTDVRFETYHSDHGFGNVRDQLHQDILSWIEAPAHR